MILSHTRLDEPRIWRCQRDDRLGLDEDQVAALVGHQELAVEIEGELLYHLVHDPVLKTGNGVDVRAHASTAARASSAATSSLRHCEYAVF